MVDVVDGEGAGEGNTGTGTGDGEGAGIIDTSIEGEGILDSGAGEGDVEGTEEGTGEGSGGGEDEGEGSGEGSPEAYADFDFPEGITANEGMLEKFSPFAKELGLSQENAQKLLNFHTESLQKAVSPEHIADSVLKAQESLNKAQSAKWVDELKADEVIGGSNLDAATKMANQAITMFGDNALKADLKEFGWSSNPSLIRLLNKVGMAIAEDSLGNGGGGGNSSNSGGSGDKSAADLLYPDQAKAS